jgi:hypothetical protein
MLIGGGLSRQQAVDLQPIESMEGVALLVPGAGAIARGTRS